MCTATGVAPGPLPLPTDLPSALVEIEALRARVAELTKERDELAGDLAAVKAELDQVVRRFFGPKSERLGPEQSLLFSPPPATGAAPAAPEAVVEELVKAHRRRRRQRRHPGRGCYPKDLPREPVHVPTPPELLVCACGGPRHKVGEVCSERLDVVPAQFRIVELVRDKLACARCDGVVSPPLPPEPITRGLPTPRLLAHIVVSKYCDHLPLARQETIYALSSLP
jgi:transposase